MGTNRTAVASDVLAALRERTDASFERLAGHLAEDVELQAIRGGSVRGRDAVLAQLREQRGGDGGGRGAQLMGRITWAAPVEQGDAVVVEGSLPAGLPVPIKGIGITVRFDGSELVSGLAMEARR